MIPFYVLIASFAGFLLLGRLGVGYFQGWQFALRGALGIMFLLTASAHWGKRRADLVRMVPPVFPRPEMWIILTGVFEVMGALGLQIAALAPWASAGLAVMLVAIFPANVHAARNHMQIGGRPVPTLLVRSLIQIVFLVATIAAGWPYHVIPLSR